MATVRPLLLDQRDTGGAGNATRRIHKGLRAIGVESRLLVREHDTTVEGVLGPKSKIGRLFSWLRPYVDKLPLSLVGSPNEFSLNWVPDRIPARVNSLDPDVVHLNWVAGSYLRIESLSAIDAPLVWRLPDMWALTGGCHYSNDCDGYRDNCGNCPKLASDRTYDLSRLTMARKRRALADVPVTIVATSSWLADRARESSLFRNSRIEVIPNGLDTEQFRPYDQSVARDVFGLPQDKSLILFGAVGPLTNPRKGGDLLTDAVQSVSENRTDSADVVVFGASEPDDPINFGVPAHYTGYLNDTQSLALLYSAADVMVVPSRYEGFGQTVTEAMACGTPVVAFDATGPSDTVVHEETGYLATPYDPDDLAAGIRWALSNSNRLGSNARQRALDTYDSTTVAEQYRSLYRSVTE